MNKKLTLKDLGAEKCINLLKPIKCLCGCNGYAQIILKSIDDMLGLATDLLREEECQNALIVIMSDTNIIISCTGEDGIEYCEFVDYDGNSIRDFDEQVKSVKALIEDAKPHCVGVLQHTKNNHYRVVMDTIYDN